MTVVSTLRDPSPNGISLAWKIGRLGREGCPPDKNGFLSVVQEGTYNAETRSLNHPGHNSRFDQLVSSPHGAGSVIVVAG